MKKKIGMILLGVGILFLFNAIFGRYLVLPGYLSSLEKGKDAAPPSVWGIIKYVIWGYSFKIGVFLSVIGASLYTSMKSIRFWLLIIGGFIYLILAYVPIPGPYSIFFW